MRWIIPIKTRPRDNRVCRAWPLVFCLLTALTGFAAPAAAQQVAVLQGLDKITARISTIAAPIDSVVTFGSLQIQARACHKRPPEEPPESAAFLEIVDNRPDSEPVRIFSGWMFASSPALSALEHPVYDVWVLDCRLVVELVEAPALGEAPESLVVPGSGTEGDPGP